MATEDQNAWRELQEEGAAGLVGQILTASMNQNVATMDRLYEIEKARADNLQALINRTLTRLDYAYQGSVREYEEAIQELRRHDARNWGDDG